MQLLPRKGDSLMNSGKLPCIKKDEKNILIRYAAHDHEYDFFVMQER